MNIFEQATRKALRFATTNGAISTEDLWDLPLTSKVPNRANLDDIAKNLHAELQKGTQKSFVTETSEADSRVQLEFDVVIHVINTKISEQKLAAQAAEIRAKKQRIMTLIEQKQDEQLGATSIEELQQMLAAL